MVSTPGTVICVLVAVTVIGAPVARCAVAVLSIVPGRHVLLAFVAALSGLETWSTRVEFAATLQLNEPSPSGSVPHAPAVLTESSVAPLSATMNPG